MCKLTLVPAYNAHARHCSFSYAPARGFFSGFPGLFLESVLNVEKWMSSHMKKSCFGRLCIQGLILLCCSCVVSLSYARVMILLYKVFEIEMYRLITMILLQLLRDRMKVNLMVLL
jgi:hypothetical protein